MRYTLVMRDPSQKEKERLANSIASKDLGWTYEAELDNLERMSTADFWMEWRRYWNLPKDVL